MIGNKAIYMSTIHKWVTYKTKELKSLLDLSKGESEYINIVCTKDEKSKEILKNIPNVKVEF